MKFSRLEALQLDVSHWSNAPLMPYAHRMLVTELRTYCTSLNTLVVWYGTQQTIWRYEREQWSFQQVPGPRYNIRDMMWREY